MKNGNEDGHMLPAMPPLRTRFTEHFGLDIPVALAPMALASGGALAAACAQAGALGLVGGGYGELEWTQREYAKAFRQRQSHQRIGCGFITWKLDEDASALDWILDLPPSQLPRAVMLSFGDPRPYSQRIAAKGAELICQVQRMDQVPQAIEAGACVIVAQGVEAGGHGMNALHGRATMAFVPELADWLAVHAPNTLLLAAGGIADGRTLAAALLLGADGALVGTRLWASQESLASPSAKVLAVQTPGDGTARSSVFDILRRKNWPAPYNFRALRNALHRQWEERIDALQANPQPARTAYELAVQTSDWSGAHVTVGESVGLVRDIPAAAQILRRMHEESRIQLQRKCGLPLENTAR